MATQGNNCFQRFFIVATAVIVPSLCQYAMQTGLRPDVTFGENNDRFDVTSLIRRQKDFKGHYDPQSVEYRRRNKPRKKDVPLLELLNSDRGRKTLRKKFKKTLENHVNQLANTIITKIRNMRRNDDDFAYHDNMNSEGGDVEDFNRNLRDFENVHNFKEDSVGDEPLRKQYRLLDIVNKLHENNETRRTALDPVKEILLHYAFPVDMKIEGFLQTPLN